MSHVSVHTSTVAAPAMAATARADRFTHEYDPRFGRVVSCDYREIALDEPHEECGLIGVYHHTDASLLSFFGLIALQHRGQEGAGIVSFTTCEEGGVQKSDVHQKHGLGLVSEVFSQRKDFSELPGTIALGHVRYSTCGDASINNIQPFVFKFSDTSVALAHNGNLVNGITLRKQLEEKGAIFNSSSDSEILMHLIRHSAHTSFHAQIKDALLQVKGGFTYILATADELIGACDPCGFRPLSVGKLPDGGYCMASESCALNQIGATFMFDVEPGEIVYINNDGITREYYTSQRQQAICAMEYIYFARPDSVIHDVCVHTARKRSGEILAREAPCPNADLVIGVPNSSLSAAMGYAEAAGLPNEMGLVKNQYIGRTFIQPTQTERRRGVRMKLSAVRKIVEGKSIVMVDDSIVRGTTSRLIVALLFEAGAREVHVRIASPALRYPCFYGINISDTRELIAAGHSLAYIRDFIGATSLAYLSEQGLIDAINLQVDAPYQGLCMAYFNGDYPTRLFDYEQDYKASLAEVNQVPLKHKSHITTRVQ